MGLMCMFIAEVSEALVGWDTVVVGQSENGFDRRDVLFLSGDVALLTIFTAIFEGETLFNREHMQVVHDYWYFFALAPGWVFW